MSGRVFQVIFLLKIADASFTGARGPGTAVQHELLKNNWLIYLLCVRGYYFWVMERLIKG